MPQPDALERVQRAVGDRYGVERELARGGMATVYFAKDLRHGRSVALKVMDATVVGAIGADRFLREIEIAARLAHPHIVPLFDSGEARREDGPPLLFYVMPFIAGETLRERLARSGTMPQAEVARLLREVASALDYAHRQGVVHRDIKPENILVSEGHAVVSDFGIARAVLSATSSIALTETGVVVGTPAYLSPEQAGDGTQLDGRCDQYSLACVAYELLTGRPPFTGKSAVALLAQHLSASPAALRGTETVSDAAERAVLRALAKDPDSRFPTVADFAEAFARGPDGACGATTLRATARRRGRSARAPHRLPGREDTAHEPGPASDLRRARALRGAACRARSARAVDGNQGGDVACREAVCGAGCRRQIGFPPRRRQRTLRGRDLRAARRRPAGNRAGGRANAHDDADCLACEAGEAARSVGQRFT